MPSAGPQVASASARRAPLELAGLGLSGHDGDRPNAIRQRCERRQHGGDRASSPIAPGAPERLAGPSCDDFFIHRLCVKCHHQTVLLRRCTVAQRC